MPITARSAALNGFVQTLKALDAILDKTVEQATARKIAPEVLLSSRLAPDMLPFSRQIQLACDFAKNGAYRLAGIDPPKVPDDEKTLADLRGRKIRTFGNSLVDFFTAFGAQPVSIGFPEVYSALERGVVDCAITGTGSGVAARWPEVTTHISNLPVSWALAGYMVNVAWWNRLDPAVRTFMEGTFREMSDKQWELGDAATRDGIDCAIGNAAACRIHSLSTRPMTEVPATPADRAALREILEKTVLPGFIRRCGARCGEVFNQVIAPIAGVRAGG